MLQVDTGAVTWKTLGNKALEVRDPVQDLILGLGQDPGSLLSLGNRAFVLCCLSLEGMMLRSETLY